MIHKREIEMAAEMLELASAAFSNHGCNDYTLEANANTLGFVRRMIAASDYPDDVPNIDGTKIYVMDTDVMDYCARYLRNMAANL